MTAQDSDTYRGRYSQLCTEVTLAGMRATAGGTKTRRTQQERRSATRSALLEATLDVLVEEGYANLTTTKVATRANVSRGAQVHHFPTKAALVAEAVQYLISEISQSLLGELPTLPGGRERDSAALDLLWDVVRGKRFQAFLELSVAAAHDAEIRERLAMVNEVTTGIIRSAVPVLFPDEQDQPYFEDALFTAVNTMSGLALSQRVAGVGDAELDARWRRTKRQLLSLIPSRHEPTDESHVHAHGER